MTRLNSWTRRLAVAALLLTAGNAARADIYVADSTADAIYEFTTAGAQTTLSTTVNNPTCLTSDAAGNIYEADRGSGAGGIVTKYPAGGGQQSVVASGFNNPFGLAFDSAGNLFVSSVDPDTAAGTIFKVTPAGMSSVFASGLQRVRGLAFDASGNLYAAELDSGSVFKYTADGTQSTFATGFNYPTGIAFDGSGNLFVCSQGVGVFEVTPVGVVSTFTTNVTDPRYLAFDATGNLYVTDVGDASGDPGQGTVYLFAPDGTRTTFASNLAAPLGVAVSGLPVVAAPPAIGAVSVSVDASAIKRSAGQSATVTFTRSGDLSAVIKVKYSLSGSVASGKDFVALSGKQKIKAGKSTGSLQITPLAGGGAGKLKLTVLPGTGYTVGSPSTLKVKIK